MEHISIFNKKIYKKDYIEMILNGRKTADAKFSSKKYPPYNKLNVGDRVYLKESGKEIVGHTEIKKVQFIELENSDHVRSILFKNKKVFAIENEKEFEEIFEGRKHKKYCTLFFFKNSKRYDKPIKYSSRGRSSWVVKFK